MPGCTFDDSAAFGSAFRLTAAVDAINRRYGRTLIGYGQCGETGGDVGAKIAYGRIPELEDFQ